MKSFITKTDEEKLDWKFDEIKNIYEKVTNIEIEE